MTKKLKKTPPNSYSTPLAAYIGLVQMALTKREITSEQADFLIALYTKNQLNQKIQLKLNQYFSTSTTNLNNFLSYGRKPAY